MSQASQTPDIAPVDPERWYSVRQAARLLRVKPVRIRQLLADKTFKQPQKVGRSWLISGAEIQHYEEIRRPVGRPKGTLMYKLDVLGRRRRIKQAPRQPQQFEDAAAG